jgi:hypothetical protein
MQFSQLTGFLNFFFLVSEENGDFCLINTTQKNFIKVTYLVPDLFSLFGLD